MHEGLEPGSATYEQVAGGMPFILSGLKDAARDRRAAPSRVTNPARTARSRSAECREQELEHDGGIAPDAALPSGAVTLPQIERTRVAQRLEPALSDQLLVDSPSRPPYVVYTGTPSAAASRFIVPPAETTTSESAIRLCASTALSGTITDGSERLRT